MRTKREIQKEREKNEEKKTKHTWQKKKLHSPAAMWTRISAPTKPPHTQVIYDIEIDDNFYYMHFRLNLRNKIVDYSPHFFLVVFVCF